jgi:three-Cys-motif partner protein
MKGTTGAADDSRWKYEPHMECKHRILAYYLPLWCRIIGKATPNLTYWDCFAGRGDYADGTPGSPLIAMDVSESLLKEGDRSDHPINLKCIFIEKNLSNYRYLRNLLRDLYSEGENKRWRLYNGSFEQVYKNLTSGTDDLDFSIKHPSFFFLDPYGVGGLPLSIVRDIMSRSTHEILVNFMAETVKRFRGASSMSNSLKALFGVDDLSHLRQIIGYGNPEQKIAEYYVERLRAPDGARIRYLAAPFAISTNKRDVIKYYLIFGTSHPKGLNVMFQAERAVSNNEDLSYKGRKEGQKSLESFVGDKVQELADWVYANRTSRVMTFNLIWALCCQHKSCYPRELRTAVQRLEDEGRVTIRPQAGRKRIGRTFSDHLIVFNDLVA